MRTKPVIAVFILMVVCAMLIGVGVSQTDIYPYDAPRKPKSIVKVTRLGTNDVAIVCLNGADPTGYKPEQKNGKVNIDLLIISCGK